MRHRPRRHSALALGLGIVLLAGGVVLLFIPGPGLLLILFGLALVASHSERLSRLLDRAEPALRRSGRRAKLRWQAAPSRAKVGLVLGLVSAAGAFLVVAWRIAVAAHLIG
ncbi:MAG TPA: PGPGW domain-containing protein [Kofleriaceae bacterium]|nr:PGPGW domain-containing protein [Kofleriaceae bacterium]